MTIDKLRSIVGVITYADEIPKGMVQLTVIASASERIDGRPYAEYLARERDRIRQFNTCPVIVIRGHEPLTIALYGKALNQEREL